MSDISTTTFRIEFVNADPGHPDPAVVGQAARDAVDGLHAAGYNVRPVYTGTLGGAEIYELLRALADGAQANKDIVLALIASIAAPIAATLMERLKESSKTPAAPTPSTPVQVIVIVGGAQAAVHDSTITADDLLRQLLAADPGLAERVTPQTEVSIRVAIPAQPQRKRR